MHKLRLAQCNKRFYGIFTLVCYILNGKVVYNCQAFREQKAAVADIVLRGSQKDLRLQYVGAPALQAKGNTAQSLC